MIKTNTTIMNQEEQIGRKIRLIREEQALTISDLAQRTKLEEDMLNQLEAGELGISLSPLIKIARALGVRPGTFLDDTVSSEPVIVRAQEKQAVPRFTGGSQRPAEDLLHFHSLAKNKKDRHMEPFIIEIKKSNPEQMKLSDHEGEEFIYVLSGKLTIRYGKEEYQLETGDSIYYDSIVPHQVFTDNHEDAKILAVVYTPN